MSSNIQVQENIEKDTSFDYPSPTSPSVSKTQSKESLIEVKAHQQHNFTKIGIFKPAYFSRAIFKQLENLQISKTQFFKELKKQSELENQTELEDQCKDKTDLSYNLQFRYFTEFIHNFNQVTGVTKEKDFQIQYFTEFIHNFNQVIDVTKEKDLQIQYFTEFIHNFNQATDVTKEDDFQIQYFSDFVHFLDQHITDSATVTSSSSSAASFSNLNNSPHKTDKVIQFIHNPIKPNQKNLGKLEKFKNFIKYGTTKGKETENIPKHVEKYVLNKIKIAKTTNNNIDISSIAETLKQEQLTQEELDYCLYKIYSSGSHKHAKFKKSFKKNKNKKEPPIKGCLKNKINLHYNLEKKNCEESDSQTILKFLTEVLNWEYKKSDPTNKKNIEDTQLQQVQNYYGNNVEVYLEQETINNKNRRIFRNKLKKDLSI
ncbi:hypothetical protein KGF54_005485 [Candida jiufengensis]|uniref:uncharacterized protein n=1 Tax=Candida jiufengensis TaxID=497108 RepID=UPI002225A528|nr:uncharacterized protein KGF54_005485 [Candida jiufengensis]KAI5949607.1 hypothetical protein KGF54_005485 [Candida jiufengensis]